MLFQVCKISDLKRGRSHCHYLIMRFNGRIKSRFFVSVDQIRHLHPHPRSSHAAPIPPDTSITTVCETETLVSCTQLLPVVVLSYFSTLLSSLLGRKNVVNRTPGRETMPWMHGFWKKFAIRLYPPHFSRKTFRLIAAGARCFSPAFIIPGIEDAIITRGRWWDLLDNVEEIIVLLNEITSTRLTPRTVIVSSIHLCSALTIEETESTIGHVFARWN